MKKFFTKIAGVALGLAMAIGVGAAIRAGVKEVGANAAAVYTEITSASSSDIVSDNSYGPYSSDDWIITHGGYSRSVGTNKNNRENCNLSSYSKYAVSPVTTSSTASAFVSKTSISNVSKVKYTYNGGSNDTATNVYLIYSSNDTTYSELSLTSGTQGATISSGTEYVFEESSGYFGLLFEATNTSGNWRIDNVQITFYEKEEEKTISYITLSEGENLKKSYVNGDSVDVSNIVATATYSDNSEGDVTDSCTISPNIDTVDLLTTSITYSAVYNGEEEVPAIESLVVNVTVVPVSVSSLASYGSIKVDFNENEAFSIGTGKIQINYNNGTYERVGLDQEGLSVSIGGYDITGMTYYVQVEDAAKEVVVSYSGSELKYNVGTVTAEEESEDGYYELINSTDDLVLNDKYLIVNSTNNVALSTTQNTNNRGQASVTIDDNKISTISNSVEVLTLVEGTVTTYDNKSVTTYGLKTSSNGYLYAASSGSNYLKTEDTLDDNGSFTISFSGNNAVLTAKGTYTRNLLKYNSSSSIFSCYGSGQQDVQLFHFVEETKSADQIAVEEFVDAFMHLDDVSINNRSDTNACRNKGTGAKSYYSLAKEAYNDDDILTDAQRVLFRTSQVFKIARAYERLSAWAEANNDSFNSSTNKLEANRFSISPITDSTDLTPMISIVATVVAATVIIGGYFFLRKRKEQ